MPKLSSLIIISTVIVICFYCLLTLEIISMLAFSVVSDFLFDLGYAKA